jgi:hypothetical protein
MFADLIFLGTITLLCFYYPILINTKNLSAPQNAVSR